MSRSFLREILKQGPNTTVSSVYTDAYGVSVPLKQGETETRPGIFEKWMVTKENGVFPPVKQNASLLRCAEFR